VLIADVGQVALGAIQGWDPCCAHRGKAS
jgi:hypothetical protein